MKKITGLLILLVFASSALLAQGMPDPKVPQGENLKIPEGWEVRLDRPMDNLVISSEPDSGDIYFVNMTPGWHVTTGPRAIFWHPENKAEGGFTLNASIYLFDTKGRDREGFGVFFGGSNLQEEDQEYLYFLIRNTGDFLIKARKGEETETLKEWTASEAIVRYTEESESSVLNTLSVNVMDGMIHFLINDQEVAMLGTKELKTNGLFGLRVNHAVNLHISNLGLSK